MLPKISVFLCQKSWWPRNFKLSQQPLWILWRDWFLSNAPWRVCNVTPQLQFSKYIWLIWELSAYTEWGDNFVRLPARLSYNILIYLTDIKWELNIDFGYLIKPTSIKEFGLWHILLSTQCLIRDGLCKRNVPLVWPSSNG